MYQFSYSEVQTDSLADARDREEQVLSRSIDLLQAARDKGIERDEVLEAMEQAIQKAGRSKYGHEHDIRAVIDRTSGAITLARYLEVVEDADRVEVDSSAWCSAALCRATIPRARRAASSSWTF